MSKSLIDRVSDKVAVLSLDECWPWLAAKDTYGYGRVGVGGSDTAPAHRVMFSLLRGVELYEIPKELEVCHSCDNPVCCNPTHLWLGTKDDNLRDKILKGRAGSVITASSVLEARRMHYLGNYSISELAAIFKICPQNMSAIIRRVTWKHL